MNWNYLTILTVLTALAMEGPSQKESRLEQLTPAHVATEAVRVVDVRQTLHPSSRPHAQRDVTGGAGDGRVGLVYPEHLETG